MENNRLIAIPSAEWPRLRDLYRLDWPANLTAFYTLDTFRRWSTETRVPNLIVYSLDGDWTRDGTFVCVVSGLYIVLFEKGSPEQMYINITNV